MRSTEEINKAIVKLTALKELEEKHGHGVPGWMLTALEALYHYRERTFDVALPGHTLRVRAKTPRDVPEDYPGIYVEMAPEGSDDFRLLTVVEYNAREDVVQTCVYGDPEEEFPTSTTKFR